MIFCCPTEYREIPSQEGQQLFVVQNVWARARALTRDAEMMAQRTATRSRTPTNSQQPLDGVYGRKLLYPPSISTPSKAPMAGISTMQRDLFICGCRRSDVLGRCGCSAFDRTIRGQRQSTPCDRMLYLDPSSGECRAEGMARWEGCFDGWSSEQVNWGRSRARIFHPDCKSRSAECRATAMAADPRTGLYKRPWMYFSDEEERAIVRNGGRLDLSAPSTNTPLQTLRVMLHHRG